jgi:hypothetical protein
MSNRDPIEINGRIWEYDATTSTHRPVNRADRNNDRASVSATVKQRTKRNALSKASKGSTISSRVDIEIYSYRVHTADTDAPYLKPCLDGIVDSGLIANDSAKEVRSVRFWAAEKAETISSQKTIIKIRVVE